MGLFGEGFFVPAAPAGCVFLDPLDGGLTADVALYLLAAYPAIFGDLFALEGEHVLEAVFAPLGGAAGKPVSLGAFPAYLTVFLEREGTAVAFHLPVFGGCESILQRDSQR